VVTSAHNLSSTSVRLSWRPPTAASVHGELVGYRIQYRKHGDADHSVAEVH
jgi:hypothetical protein